MISLLLGLLPWILLQVLPTKTLQELSITLIIIFFINTILSYRYLKKGFILPWGATIFFACASIAITILHLVWVAQHMEFLIYAMLSLIAWGSLLIGKSFTIQYAREQTDPSKWNHPTFIRINQILTMAWGIIFLLNIVSLVIQNYYPLSPVSKSLLSNGTTLLGILFTIWFPKWYGSKIHG